MDLALNNLQRLICHKSQQTNQPNHPKKVFCHLEHFIEDKKDGNHFLYVLEITVDRLQHNNVNPIFFSACLSLNVSLH